MGLNSTIITYINSSIRIFYGYKTEGLHMLELGDQVIPGDPESTGKDYFTSIGYNHASVDINGLHGAIPRDLTKPEMFRDWHNSFDIITNSGTTEHVEPHAGQYTCFNIIHDCLKLGGVAIHILPDVYELDTHGHWKNHCHYYYSETFFNMLAEDCGYELLSNIIIDNLRCATLKKVKNIPFMKNTGKFLDNIYIRS